MALPMYLSMTEAARYLGVSRPTLYRLTDRGEIAYCYLPGISGRRVSRSALVAYTNRRVPGAVKDDGLPRRSRARKGTGAAA